MASSTPRGWKRPALLATLGCVTIGALAAGGTALAATAGSHSQQHAAQAQNAAAPRAPHVFARNAHGLSYGSELDATDPANAPDLIAAYATNGKLGYVLKKDLHPQGLSGPAAAVHAQAAMTTPTPIPVYAIDGVTRIGVYLITPPNGG